MSAAKSVKDDPAARAMPPPPNPTPPQEVILGPELNALTTSLKNAVTNTGKIYSFYTDRARLNHSYKPPDSLTASLGREVEKYDQLCDAIESHLLRAIAVLQRDLRREEQRKKDATLAASKGKPGDTLRAAEAIAAQEAVSLADNASATPVPTSSPVVVPPGRRPSAISISSLQRPVVPLKLDLSSSSLRISEDSALFSGGLASPVTLAPKSARALGSNEFPPELMAAFASATSTTANPSAESVGIDLTVEDNETRLPMEIDQVAGSSADKPIELDLDTMEIDMPDLFSDPGAHGNTTRPLVKSQKEGNFLSTFTGDARNIMFPRATKPSSSGQRAQSPSTILANFSQPGSDDGAPLNSNGSATAGGTTFDISSLDLSHLSPSFFSNSGDTDAGFSMDDFLGMGGAGKENNAP
ncbi:hypothetical protein AX15_001126 [Amanita polypyramis BW_CC]|nr:hypothetical protein AX15_001126 [Amanita polypyramis BW_CC]